MTQLPPTTASADELRREARRHHMDELSFVKLRLMETTHKTGPAGAGAAAGYGAFLFEALRARPYTAALIALGLGFVLTSMPRLRRGLMLGALWGAKRGATQFVRHATRKK